MTAEVNRTDAVLRRSLRFRSRRRRASGRRFRAGLRRADDEAIACLRRATKLEPKRAAFQAQLSSALFQNNRFAEAETTARRALALDPRNDMAAFNLGMLLLRRGR